MKIRVSDPVKMYFKENILKYDKCRIILKNSDRLLTFHNMEVQALKEK